MPTNTRTRKPRVATAHNGYFTVYELGCGCRIRINTEQYGYSLKCGSKESKAATRKFIDGLAARSAERHTCPQVQS